MSLRLQAQHVLFTPVPTLPILISPLPFPHMRTAPSHPTQKRPIKNKLAYAYVTRQSTFITTVRNETKVIYVFQYEDFEVLSQTAREVWLAEQCSAFETQIQTLSREREKDHFLEELYRKLKQLTRRWQSWNHRSFGGVTSRGCVCSCCTLIFHKMELFI